MGVLGGKKSEGTVQVTCEVSKEVENKIKKIRKKKGRRTRWIVTNAIKEFLKGDIDV